MNTTSAKTAILQNPRDAYRLILAALIPLAAFGLQWFFWAAIQPYAWFLFFPAVFFSSWVGGLRGGLVATILSTGLVWYFFISPQFSFAVQSPMSLVSIGMFVGMGVLFSLSHGRLRKANQRAAEALEAAHSANSQLQAANEKITRLYEKTRELDELKTQFFANVSHELRTPLTLILGPIGKRLASGGLDAAERRDLEVVDRNARLLYRHVSDLLDVAKLEAGRMKMLYAQADLAKLVRFIASHFESLAAERQIRFAVDGPATLPAQVDAEKCERTLLNLLSNAFKFTPAAGAVSLTLKTEGDRAVIQVQDTGPGVPTELREAIFEPFRQGESGTDRRFGGTGLGLAIVKEFVGLHGGKVAVADVTGGGALFTVRLPLAAPADTEVRPLASTLDPEISRQTLDELHAPTSTSGPITPQANPSAPLILVVEDNPDMNAYIAGALDQHYRIATAFDGQEGLNKALELSPDLIISDVMMPCLSGEKMVAALRQHPELNDVPIVMLTAKADDALRVKLLQSGVQDYLTKPFSAEELRARVGGLVTKRRQTLAEILRLNASLERRVQERTCQLEEANKELESFSYSVSHDLRAPLRGIDGWSQALVEDYGGKLDDQAREYLAQVCGEAQRMGQLIDDLLQLSRVTRAEMRREPVDLSARAEGILADLRKHDRQRQVEIVVAPGLSATGDPRLLRLVLENLLGNAWKFTGKRAPARIEFGTVAAEVTRLTPPPAARRPPPAEIDQSLLTSAATVFFIRDNGAGFDMAHATKLFAPFQRLHRPSEFPGTGIGLATVQRIIRRHGGKVWAEAERDQGATFYFTLSTNESNYD